MVAATSFQPILEQGYQVITLWVKADLSAFSCVFFRSEDDLVIEWLLESQHFARSMKSQLCWKRFFSCHVWRYRHKTTTKFLPNYAQLAVVKLRLFGCFLHNFCNAHQQLVLEQFQFLGHWSHVWDTEVFCFDYFLTCIGVRKTRRSIMYKYIRMIKQLGLEQRMLAETPQPNTFVYTVD